MKYKCNDCSWSGYGLASDGGKDGESVCPSCGSKRIEPIKNKDVSDNFSDPEGDMDSIDDYYGDIGSGMA
ncbi:hypothetical protein KKA39_00975 [Patescibacteria group bacterium]|nr:hypothetical protein [Patescibacteria group bacterium]